MLSVITPTMWAYEPFCDFLKYVVRLDCIGEVIIINNDQSKTPDHPVLSHEKVRLINCNENMYVNPSWNLGAELAQFETLCFLSDDVIVDLRAFYKVDEFIAKTENVGMVYICPGYPDHDQPKVTTGEIDIETGIVTNRYGYGAFFFMKKEDWYPIPEQFKIWFGDHITFMSCQEKKKTSYYIKNCFFYTPWAVTVKHVATQPGYNVKDDQEFKVYQGVGK
jgi:hypothetical protein